MAYFLGLLKPALAEYEFFGNYPSVHSLTCFFRLMDPQADFSIFC
jgi:hypothetical protein